MKKIDFVLTFPSAKKNSKRIGVTKYGKVTVRSSEKHEYWHSCACVDIFNQFKGKIHAPDYPLENTELIELYFYQPDRRKRDLTNCEESVMDLLVDVGILADDNMEIVKKKYSENMGVFKDNSYVRVVIHIS